MNIKSLKYRTEWVHYPDIEPLSKNLGAKPTSVKADGVTPHYTLPALYDPSTNTVISNSFDIVAYLDKTYPHTPALLPRGTTTFQAGFVAAVELVLTMHVYALTVYPSYDLFPDESKAFWRTTREVLFGMKLEDVAPEGSEKRRQRWKDTEAALGKVAEWYDATGTGSEGTPSVFLSGGPTPSFADLVVVGRLVWARTVFGKESQEWRRIHELDGGRWGRLVDSLKSFETTG